MESASNHSSSLSSGVYWTDWYLSKVGNEFFCQVDADYITDRFNLTNLQTELPHFSRAFRLITDSFDEDLPVAVQVEVDIAAKHLYGLIHSRFILTGAGLAKMAIKFNNAEFGVCPRVLCANQPVLPIGLSDLPGERSVKTYCPRCQDVYVSENKLHHHIDGVYFGTTFPHMFLLTLPQKVESVKEVYQAKIFGFRVHEAVENVKRRQALRDTRSNSCMQE